MMMKPLSRRTILQGAGVGASALLLSGCSAGSTKLEPATDVSETQKSLRFDSRDSYRNTTGEDFPLLDAFIAKSGISTTYTNAVSDDNVYYGKVKGQLKLGQDIGADAVVISDWMATRWIRMGYVQKFDRARIPNFNNIRIQFQEVAYDKGRRMTMPWRNGFTGIAWNKELLPNGLRSVSDLWDPTLAGKVGVMSSMRDTMGMIMLDDGVDIAGPAWGDPEFTNAVNLLRTQVQSKKLGSIKGNKYKEDLMSGEIVASIARAGDIMQINAQAGDKWGFAIPDKGGVLWSDVAVVPTGATHKQNVEDFLNFYYDRSNAAQVASLTGFITPVDVRQPEIGEIPQERAGNQMIFPSEATFNTVKAFRTLSQGEEQRYGAQFQTVLLGGA
ncbi:MAG: extracellular solute-binding protein [Terrimesophilobacter sp.]